MPVNSFDDYPMSFKPKKEDIKVPMYLSLAKELENQIISGKLKADVLLPPQRELADFLDINLGTVTRAYKICQLREKGIKVLGSSRFSAGGLSEKSFLRLLICSPESDEELIYGLENIKKICFLRR